MTFQSGHWRHMSCGRETETREGRGARCVWHISAFFSSENFHSAQTSVSQSDHRQHAHPSLGPTHHAARPKRHTREPISCKQAHKSYYSFKRISTYFSIHVPRRSNVSGCVGCGWVGQGQARGQASIKAPGPTKQASKAYPVSAIQHTSSKSQHHRH